jgi:hypothetical protein
LVIVETKLWKNPEGQRSVIAQVIDYAKQIVGWSYDGLESAIRQSRRTRGESTGKLEEVVADFLATNSTAVSQFQEGVADCLRSGHLLLLVVGEKLAPNLVLLSETIAAAPHLDFRIGLVELRLFTQHGTTDYPLTVIPHVVGRTVEQTRAVVEIKYKDEKPTVAVTVNQETSRQGKTSKEQFLEDLPSEALRNLFRPWLQRWEELGIQVRWGTKGLSLRVAIDERPVTLAEIYPLASWGMSLVRRAAADAMRLDDAAYGRYVTDLAGIPFAANALAQDKKYVRTGLLCENRYPVRSRGFSPSKSTPMHGHCSKARRPTSSKSPIRSGRTGRSTSRLGLLR